jgi:hypothetical protein
VRWINASPIFIVVFQNWANLEEWKKQGIGVPLLSLTETQRAVGNLDGIDTMVWILENNFRNLLVEREQGSTRRVQLPCWFCRLKGSGCQHIRKAPSWISEPGGGEDTAGEESTHRADAWA